VTACLSFRAEDRPASAAALARLLAPVASAAETLSLPPDPAQRATEILAPPARPHRWWTVRRLAAAVALVLAGVAGLTAAIALNTDGHESPPTPAPRAVAPPQTGTSVVDQARNLESWLQQHQG
jgi:hypothetical protein